MGEKRREGKGGKAGLDRLKGVKRRQQGSTVPTKLPGLSKGRFNHSRWSEAKAVIQVR